MYSRIIEEDCDYILSQTDNLRWLQDKTLFITGVNGLIASYLVEVIYYANKRNKKPINLYGIYRSDSDRLNHIQDENIHLSKHDLEYPSTLMYQLRADYVFHLACNSSPDYFTKHPIETINTNTRITNWLLKEKADCKGEFIFASSGEIYGNPEIIPTPESYEGKSLTSDIRSGYIESKRCAEALCWAYHREFGTAFKILRPFIVYGPGYKLEDTRVIPTFIRSALTKGEINIQSDGSETRAFCYIADACVQILRLLAINKSDCYNIGNSVELKILRLAQAISTHIDNIKITAGTELNTGASRVCPDINKTLETINYTNKYTLSEGVNRTIEYFKEQYARKDVMNNGQ